MPAMPVRHLYLARHGEPGQDGGLTQRGVEQAVLLGRRLAAVPFSSVRHGPLPRAAETARHVADQLERRVPAAELDAAGDYVPHVPSPDEIAPEHRAGVTAFLAGVTPEEAARGARLAAEAVRLLTGPEEGEEDSHHLVVTHAFTVGWLVRDAYHAPAWRWVGLDSGHAALTVLRYSPARPPAVVVFNDMGHLPDELRWTGFPAAMRPERGC